MRKGWPVGLVDWSGRWAGVLVTGLSGLVVALVWLVADAGWRQYGFVPALVLAGLCGWPLLARKWNHVMVAKICWMAAAVAGLATAAGGIVNGGSWQSALRGCAVWALSVAGIGAMVAVAMDRRKAWSRVGVVLFAALVAASLTGYLLDWERWMQVDWMYWGALGKRLAAVWPCRWWSGGEQRIWWEHPNMAAWWFACGAGLCLEAAWQRRPGRRPVAVGLLLLAVSAIAALFLTASRSGYLMVFAALPLLVVKRSWRWAGVVAGCMGLGLGLGSWMLAEKVAPVVPPGLPEGSVEEDLHRGGLVKRADAGRLAGYRGWAEEEMAGQWWVGRGAEATGKPLPSGLPHEHSMYVATARGGGLVALAAHLVVLGCAGWMGVRAARQGKRGPLLLWMAVVTGFLFDRSSVFFVSVLLEFPVHWVAVWWACLAAGRAESSRLSGGGVAG